jgi:hypothetical protein
MLRTRQSTQYEAEISMVRRVLLHRPFRQLLRRQSIDLTERSWRSFDEMISRALHRCAACAARDACRQWLAEAHPDASHPTFCPNGSVIEACRILDPHASPATKQECEIDGGREPTIADVLADPIIARLMNADGVEAETWQAWLLGQPPLSDGRD